MEFFHYLPFQTRSDYIDNLKFRTNIGGINVINVFVDKPFIKRSPDEEISEGNKEKWRSGELFTYYHNWLFHKIDEEIFNCNSGGIPHKHCMDTLIAQKI